jgi:hypothetical protein
MSLTFQPPTRTTNFPFNMTDISTATKRAIAESRLKKEAADRTEETEHCQQYLEDLHTVMHHRPEQSEY